MGPNALEQHIVLVGFMGAGKTTVGREVARRLDRTFFDLDEVVEQQLGSSIPELFAQYGEDGFRALETQVLMEELLLRNRYWSVIAAGGGIVETSFARTALADLAFDVLLEVDVDTAWERVRDSDRPLARDETEFRRRYEQRVPLYDEVADARAPRRRRRRARRGGRARRDGRARATGRARPGTVPWRSSPSPSSPGSTARTRSSPSAIGSRRCTSCRPASAPRACRRSSGCGARCGSRGRTCCWRSAAAR